MRQAGRGKILALNLTACCLVLQPCRGCYEGNFYHRNFENAVIIFAPLFYLHSKVYTKVTLIKQRRSNRLLHTFEGIDTCIYVHILHSYIYYDDIINYARIHIYHTIHIYHYYIYHSIILLLLLLLLLIYYSHRSIYICMTNKPISKRIHDI